MYIYIYIYTYIHKHIYQVDAAGTHGRDLSSAITEARGEESSIA